MKFKKNKLLYLKPKDINCSINTAFRCYDDFEIKSLADSISSIGIIEPLIVREKSKGKFELVAGAKRLKAAKVLNLRRVPCISVVADDEKSAFISLCENIKRSQLNFLEEAQAIKTVVRRYCVNDFEASKMLGLSQSALKNKMSLMSLSPDIREQLSKSKLGEKYARILLFLPEENRSEFLLDVISGQLSVKEAKSLAEKILLAGETEQNTLTKSEEKEPPLRKAVIGDHRLFANSLSKLISITKSSGVEAYSKKCENDKFIEYRVRILKPQTENAEQLKLV